MVIRLHAVPTVSVELGEFKAEASMGWLLSSRYCLGIWDIRAMSAALLKGAQYNRKLEINYSLMGCVFNPGLVPVPREVKVTESTKEGQRGHPEEVAVNGS